MAESFYPFAFLCNKNKQKNHPEKLDLVGFNYLQNEKSLQFFFISIISSLQKIKSFHFFFGLTLQEKIRFLQPQPPERNPNIRPTSCRQLSSTSFLTLDFTLNSSSFFLLWRDSGNVKQLTRNMQIYRTGDYSATEWLTACSKAQLASSLEKINI